MAESRGGAIILLVMVGAAVWFWQGDPARDVRGLMGQHTYDDQEAALVGAVSKNRIGSSSDVWLVKSTFVTSRVALVFGYYDDWEVCNELAELYISRYPADSYICEQAN